MGVRQKLLPVYSLENGDLVCTYRSTNIGLNIGLRQLIWRARDGEPITLKSHIVERSKTSHSLTSLIGNGF